MPGNLFYAESKIELRVKDFFVSLCSQRSSSLFYGLDVSYQVVYFCILFFWLNWNVLLFLSNLYSLTKGLLFNELPMDVFVGSLQWICGQTSHSSTNLSFTIFFWPHNLPSTLNLCQLIISRELFMKSKNIVWVNRKLLIERKCEECIEFVWMCEIPENIMVTWNQIVL